MIYADLGREVLDFGVDYDEDWSFNNQNHFIENPQAMGSDSEGRPWRRGAFFSQRSTARAENRLQSLTTVEWFYQDSGLYTTTRNRIRTETQSG